MLKIFQKSTFLFLLVAVIISSGFLSQAVNATEDYDGTVVKFSSPVVYEVSRDSNGDYGIYYYYNEASFHYDSHNFDEITQYLSEGALPFDLEISTSKTMQISTNGIAFKYPDHPEVYITSGGTVEHIVDEEAFYDLGLSFDEVLVAFKYSIFGSMSMVYDQFQDYVEPRDLLYTLEMSDYSVEGSPEFGFYSKYAKNIYTYPTYTEGDEVVFDVESQSIWLSNPSVIAESSYDGSSDSDYYYIDENDDTERVYDEAIGLVFSSDFVEDFEIENEDALRVEFDIMYTGNDAIFVELGHEASSTGRPYMPSEYYGFEIDNNESFQTFYLEFDYLTTPYPVSYSSFSNGVMLYFGNVDSDEYMLIREVRLYKISE